ncbi:MAG: von Willebrand factor type A domain-containing protein [Opitutaceae bacterium]
MKNDENHPDLQTHIEPELEARLVAFVLGEASAFETAELERLVGEKPELGIFKRRIEAVHGLVGPAVRPEQAPLRLAPERRAKILEAIGAAPARVPISEPNTPVLLVLDEARRKRRKKWVWASSLAASVMFATTLAWRFRDSSSWGPTRPEPMQTVLGPESFNVELPVANQSSFEAEKPEGVVVSPSEARAASPITGNLFRQGGRGGAGGGAGGRAKLSQGQAIDALSQRLSSDAPARSSRAQILAEESAKKREISPNAPVADSFRFSFGGVGKDEADKKDFYAVTLAARPEGKASKESVQLSPFEVSTDRDRGYAAGNTLSGGRGDAPLNFSPPTSFTTKESLDDFAVATPRPNATAVGGMAAGFGGIAGGKSSPVAGVVDGFLTDLNKDAGLQIFDMSRLDRVSSAVALNQALTKQKAAATPALKSPVGESPRGETSTATEPVSTFSLHVSDVSFRLAQTALARGETPDPTRIRPEEFYNAFNYGDPSPTTSDKISARIEQAAHPLLQQRNLVRIAMKVASSGRGAGQPLHLTILLDTSGSMEREDRILSVRRALNVLASLLGKNDRVTLIGFARQPRLLVEHLAGDQANQLAELASRTPFTGGTNLEEALKLSGELARRHRDPAAQNRIVLITDGAANLGNADPAQLAAMVESLRQQNIALDACGVGTDGLDDTILEALTRKGDGRYYVINKPEDADAGFARQLAGAFRPAAENVKVQVRFNPARVGSYRLIGFEQHRLREEDFRNDKVDAAELAADEAAVALYQVEVLPQGEGELGDVFVRFRDAATGNMVERSWTMLHEPKARAFDRATPTIQLAGTAALLAEKLRGGEAGNLINLDELAPTVNRLRGYYAREARVQELITMFEQLRRRNGK